MYRYHLVPFILFLGALSASGQTIISVTGPAGGFTDYSGAAQSSWTQTGTFTGVTIQATLVSCFGTATGAAYLTLNGTSAGNQVAVNNALSINGGSTGATAVATVFSGLTLGPGTYYLTLNPAGTDECPDIWQNIASASTPAVTVATGVTAGSSGISPVPTGYPPANTFSGRVSFLYTVTGSAASAPSATPAPPTGILLGAGMLLAFMFWYVKRYRRQPASNFLQ